MGGPDSSMESATPIPSSQSSPCRLWQAPSARQRLLDDVETLINSVAAHHHVGRIFPDRFDPVGVADLVLAPDLEGAHAEHPCKIVEGAFDGEGRLRGAISAKPAGRNHVGVDGIPVGLLVDAAVGGDRAAERGGQRLASVSAIGAGVGHHAHLDCGQRAIALRTELYMRLHRMARGGADELLLARELPHDRTSRPQRGQHAQIFAEHLLLAAKSTADALGEYMHVAVEQSEQIAELLLGDERRLRARPYVQPPILAPPGEASRASPGARAARVKSNTYARG